MGYSSDGSYESAYEPAPPESQPGLMHRGVIGGGTVSRPGLASIADRAELEGPGAPTFGRRHILGALAVFAVVVVALATWGRDVRSARVDGHSSGAAAAIGR